MVKIIFFRTPKQSASDSRRSSQVGNYIFWSKGVVSRNTFNDKNYIHYLYSLCSKDHVVLKILGKTRKL